MQFTHNLNLELYSEEYHRQEIFDLIKETNPSGSCLVLSVKDEIADRPGSSADVETHFYVVETSDEKAWALFEISWDDNRGIWQRSVLHGVLGVADQDQAADLLLNQYWKSLNLDEDDIWAEVLLPFRVRAEKIISDTKEIVLSDEDEFTMLSSWQESLKLVFHNSHYPRLVFEKFNVEGYELVFESLEISTGIKFWDVFEMLCGNYQHFDHVPVLENLDAIAELNAALAAEIREVYNKKSER